jgi:FdhD protein
MIHSSARSIEIATYRSDGKIDNRRDEVAAEEPLEIRIEGHSIAVVMRTPGHDRELAAGFLLSEGIVRSRSEIFEITQCASDSSEQGNVVAIALSNPATFDPKKFTRHVFASSSCGICARTSIEAVRQQFPKLDSAMTVRAEIFARLSDQLAAAQKTFQRTGGLHACALFDRDGTLLAIREDVGRHNALDKLIESALLEDRIPLRDRILLLSGRVSFEMMQKALAGGIAMVAAISAPTTLAIECARENDQTLIAFLRDGTMNIYAGGERILPANS